MEHLINDWLLPNWQRKLVALLAATIVWVFVNQSITETKTLPGVPIKIVNLPVNKTIDGLMPNGLLNRRITLTISGTKNVIENLEPGDLEVVLDASNAPDDWVIQVLKKNIVSLNPSVDLQNHITQIQHQEFVIEFSELVTAKIPITILPPSGTSPKGYEFLDVWPKKLMQTVSGPAEQIKQLRSTGLELILDLQDVRKARLDATGISQEGFYKDEITFPIPENWKKVAIPFLDGTLQPINDPQAKDLRIDFLRMQYIPVEKQIPIRVFYPLDQSSKVNPSTYRLAKNQLVSEENAISVFTPAVLAYHVSHLFFDIVKDHMEITIVAQTREDGTLPWSVEFMDSEILEDRYVNYLMDRHEIKNAQNSYTKRLENLWRNRFRSYMQSFRLYKNNQEKLILMNLFENSSIVVQE